jgi:hypothetical protein
MKPATLVSVAGPLIGVALVCEALNGVLRVGVVRAGGVTSWAGAVAPAASALQTLGAIRATTRVARMVDWAFIFVTDIENAVSSVGASERSLLNI